MQAVSTTKLFFMKKRTNLKRTLLVALAIGTVAALYAYKEFNRKNKSLHDVTAVADLQPAALIAQFSADEKKANAAYLGKAVQVTGTIKTIDKDDRGFYTIALGDNSSMSSVRCSVDSVESSKAAALLTNATVKIKGICTGYNADEMGLGSDVILNRCVIEQEK